MTLEFNLQHYPALFPQLALDHHHFPTPTPVLLNGDKKRMAQFTYIHICGNVQLGINNEKSHTDVQIMFLS
jgi:hypothetical protein